MKAAIIILAVLAGLAVLWFQPWAPKRYGNTPAGQRAEKIDDHVDFWLDWRPPNKIDARKWIAEVPPPETERYRDCGFGDPAVASKLVESLHAAGAREVIYLDPKYSGRFGDNVEGLTVVLPEEPAKRKMIFTAAATGYATLGEQVPPDVNQKYLYFGLRDWSPDDEEPGWLPE